MLWHQVSSDGPYQVLTVDNGSRLYTDSPCRFANLPPRLRRKTCICPPNADRTREDQELIRFRYVREGRVKTYSM